MSTIVYPHLKYDAAGQLRIAGTGIKVVLLIRQIIGFGWDAAEAQRQFPQLSLGQIYSVLAYYHDHKDDVDREIEERDKRAEEIPLKLENSELQEKLRIAKRSREAS